MDGSSKRYVGWLIGITLVVVGGVGAVNYGVDPYNRFGRNTLGVYISAERQSKATQVTRYPHDALLLGNSRAAMIPASQIEGYRFFNAAFGAATVEEMYWFLDRFAQQQKLVVLCVDLGQYSVPSATHNPFCPPDWPEILNTILSLRTLEYSIKTVSSHYANKPPTLQPDGSFETSRWFELYDRENPERTAWELTQYQNGISAYTGPPPEGMTYFHKIAAMLAARHIPCVVVIPPWHEVLAQHVMTAPSLAFYQAWRAEIAAIFPQVMDLSVSEYSRAERFFRADPVHFKPQTGVAFINQEVIPKIMEGKG